MGGGWDCHTLDRVAGRVARWRFTQAPQLPRGLAHVVARGNGTRGGALAHQAHQHAAQRDLGIAALQRRLVLLRCTDEKVLANEAM